MCALLMKKTVCSLPLKNYLGSGNFNFEEENFMIIVYFSGTGNSKYIAE